MLALLFWLLLYHRFGAGVMGKRTGILFNNEMDDFTLPNNRESYGSNNLIEPGTILLGS